MDAFSFEFQVFSRKCKSAFGLRRRERIEVQAPTFLALCFHFCSPFFASFFSTFLDFLGSPDPRVQARVRVRGGDPLNEFN